MEFSGVVLELLPSATFRVRLENNSVILVCTSGRIRKNRVRVLVGDKVRVEVSECDTSRGRLIFREA